MRLALAGIGLAAAGTLLATAESAAAGVASHAMIVSGQAGNALGGFSCATSGPQARERNFFNTGIGLPTEGYAFCGLAGGIDDRSSATGGVTSTESVTNSFNDGTHKATANARSGYTGLGVSATGTYTGSTNSFAYHAAEAAAYSTDSIPLPGSGAGTIRLGFTIDGNATSVGNSQTLTFLNYQFGGGPSFSAFIAETNRGTSRVVFPTSEGSPTGFTTSGASLSGSALASTFLTDVTLGGSIDLNLGLYAASYPGPFTGVADNDFFSTARLTRIDLFDALGQPITFSVTGASGTIYDNNGAHAAPVIGGVPEPASWAMMLAGFGLVGTAARRRRVARAAA